MKKVMFVLVVISVIVLLVCGILLLDKIVIFKVGDIIKEEFYD